MEAVLMRRYLEDRTLGHLTFFADNGNELCRFYTLELPWRDNKKNESCIPEDIYDVVPFSSKIHVDAYRILGVEGRDAILIHTGNFTKDTKGCILIGLCETDIDRDGNIDIGKSRAALNRLNNITDRKGFKLIITSDHVDNSSI